MNTPALGYPLSILPNQHGYEFCGITHDLLQIPCRIQKGADGLHRVVDVNGEPAYSRLRGWVPGKAGVR